MTERSVTHSSFTIKRVYQASASRVFRAFADPVAKAQWFGCVEGWNVLEHTLDFRVGGHEVWRGGPPGGIVHRNDTVYHDIVPNERIVRSYAMQVGDRRISVSLSSIELVPDGARTRLTFTEQVAFLDGYEGDDRERGTRDLLDSLERMLQAQ